MERLRRAVPGRPCVIEAMSFQGDPAGNVWMGEKSLRSQVSTPHNRPVSCFSALWEREDAAVVIADKGRTYWGTSCNTSGPHLGLVVLGWSAMRRHFSSRWSGHQKNFHPSGYIELHLLGKRLEYTTDINGVQCGCFLGCAIKRCFAIELLF